MQIRETKIAVTKEKHQLLVKMAEREGKKLYRLLDEIIDLGLEKYQKEESKINR